MNKTEEKSDLRKEVSRLRQQLEAEVAARRRAEAILEQKTEDLYRVNQTLVALNEQLELRMREQVAQLEETQLNFSNLIANLQTGILVEDDQRRIMLANEHFCRQFNIPLEPSQLVGADSVAAAHQSKCLFKKPDEFVKSTERLLQRRQIMVGEKLELEDGRIYLRDYIPIFSGGKPRGNMWQYRDVTAERQAEEKLRRSEEKYRGIIENMELGLLEVDNLGRVVRAYNAFCEMTGFAEGELIGRKANEVLLPPESIPIVKKQTMDRMRGKAGVYEIELYKKDGSRIWVMISGAPIYNQWGIVVGSVGIHYDITEQKKLQYELSEARQRAEEAQQAERQFLANMSHEIRTPLNAIIGMTHLMFDTSPTLEQMDYLNVLKSSADILQSLISDVLDIAKIREGKMEIHPREFDLVGLIHALEQIFQRKLEGRPVELTTRVDPSIKTLLIGDDLMLQQILLNLIGNAERFTQSGCIQLNVKVVHRLECRVTLQFEIQDTGIGIPTDKMDVIFQSFRQVDGDIKRRFGGTGLGLNIVKQLVELQNGSIWVSSEEGKGSTFTFELSYHDTGKEPNPTKPGSVVKKLRKGSELSVLMVEDNAMNRKYVSTLLEKWGIPLKMAFNGKEGLEIAQQERFDIVFLDIQMPEMDGYETAIAIRNSVNPNRQTPLVALTASAMLSKKDKAMESGMNDYVSKPFNPEQLLAVLRKYTNLDSVEAFSASSLPLAPDAQDSKLDQTVLQEIYGADSEYAREMFEAFLEKMEFEFPMFHQYFETSDWASLSRLAHKFKPALQMVGITHLEPQLQAIENVVENGMDKARISLIINEFGQGLDALMPAVREEYQRLLASVGHKPTVTNHESPT